MQFFNEVVRAIRSISEFQFLFGLIAVNIIVFARIILVRKEMMTLKQTLISTPVIMGFYLVILISNHDMFINVLMIISIVLELKSAIYHMKDQIFTISN